MKGEALRRALQTNDAYRINDAVPLIVNTTELITPDVAKEMLKKNQNNRPINWRKVEQYRDIMKSGNWRLHSQGIILDPTGNIITGQKRLHAVVLSGCSVYMQVSRGCPAETANLIDRGTTQTSTDLAFRETKRKHSPYEKSIARAMLRIKSNRQPSVDDIALVLITRDADLDAVVKETKGTKKTKAVLMILAAILSVHSDTGKMLDMARDIEKLCNALEDALAPEGAERFWGRGASFGLAMSKAKAIVEKA